MEELATSPPADRDRTCPRKAPRVTESPPLDGEIVVIDLSTDRVYSFNAPLTEVWRACDGVTPVEVVAMRLARQFDLPAGPEIVYRALHDLRRYGLVVEPRSGERRPVRITRRELGRRLRAAVPAAFALPAITAILLEKPAYAAGLSLPCVRDIVCAAGMAVCGQACYAAGSADKDCTTKACLRSLSGTGSLSCRPISTGSCRGGEAPGSARQSPRMIRRR